MDISGSDIIAPSKVVDLSTMMDSNEDEELILEALCIVYFIHFLKMI